MTTTTAAKSTPVLSYWEDEGAAEIAAKLAKWCEGHGNALEAIRKEVESQFETCDEIEEYSAHDVAWTVAGVALKLWDAGVLRRKDAETALSAANWDLSRLD